jgi:glycerol uptake facilitator-like aquaporin
MTKSIIEKLMICFYEFLGTAMLLLGYNFTATGLAVAFSLFVGIILGAKISGGMFNPAVTVAVYLWTGNILKEIDLFLMTIIA